VLTLIFFLHNFVDTYGIQACNYLAVCVCSFCPQLLGHPSLVTPGGSHILYANYLYLCDGVPGVLQDIEITLTPVGKTLFMVCTPLPTWV